MAIASARFENEVEVQGEGSSKPASFAEKKTAKDAASENSGRGVIDTVVAEGT